MTSELATFFAAISSRVRLEIDARAERAVSAGEYRNGRIWIGFEDGECIEQLSRCGAVDRITSLRTG